MMDTQHPAEDRLVAGSLGELNQEEQQQLERHVEECAECGPVFRTLQKALQGFRERPRPAAPARILVDLIAAQAAQPSPARSTSQPVMAAIRRGESTGVRGSAWRSGRWWGTSLAVAAVVVLLFVSGFVAGRRTAPTPVGPERPASAASEGTQVSVAPDVVPEPPRIPFEPAPSEANLRPQEP
jgi:hypothetical protein